MQSDMRRHSDRASPKARAAHPSQHLAVGLWIGLAEARAKARELYSRPIEHSLIATARLARMT
jgi:hypothetical protein